MRLLFIGCMLFISLVCHAQITGRVIDKETQEPIPGANIAICANDSTVTGGVATDVDGRFNIQDPHTPVFIIRFSCLGYQSFVIHSYEPILGEMGTIQLPPASVGLDEVVVSGNLKTTDATTETIIITERLRSSSSNVTDMLGKIPGIRTDITSENIKIGKDTDVPVAVNGKEVGKEYAMGLNPKRVKSIEILRYPPGQYSDYPILLNIVLNEDYMGWDLNLHGRGFASPRYGYSNRENIGADLTVTQGAWNIYSTLEYTYQHVKEASEYQYDFSGIYQEATQAIDVEKPNKEEYGNKGKLSVGMDYHIAKNHWLSAQTWLDLSSQTKSNNYDILQKEGTDYFPQQSKNKYETLNSVTGIYYKGTLSNKWRTNASLLYNYYRITDDHHFNAINAQSDNSYLGNKNYLRADGSTVYSINDQWSADLSYEFTWRNYNNRDHISNESLFTSSERRHRVYTSVAYSPLRTFQARLGMSMLHVGSSNSEESKNTDSWMPRVQLYWQPLPNMELTGRYFCSVDYPNLDMLSPVQSQVNSYLRTQGNPNLNAKVMHWAQVEMSLFKWIKLTYMWKHSSNDISEWYEIDNAANTLLRTYRNCNYKHNYIGFSIDRSLPRDFRISITSSYQWYKRYISGVSDKSGHTWYSDALLMWNVPGSKCSIMGEYFLRSDNLPLLQGKQYDEEENLMLGVRYPFLGGKLPVSFGIKLPVSALSKQTYSEISIPGYSYRMEGNHQVNNFLISLNVRFNMGKGQAKHNYNSSNIDVEK